ncbi:MAG TPA: hypothetical protein PL096_00985 [Micropepsaceae bacterium]|nr:hypothetical protein [Micropepsaceae bacterium]
MTLYRVHTVLRHGDTYVHVFTCLENLETGRFGVQQMDWISFKENGAPIEPLRPQATTLELFYDCPPEERGKFYPTLLEAIAGFEQDFSK